MVPEIQDTLTALAIDLMERGWLPDRVVRAGIRRLLAQRLDTLASRDEAERDALLERLQCGPIAVQTDAANAQHYELPAVFFERVLGPHLKYSSGLWPAGVTDLGAAEAAMLQLSCNHAALEDGMGILELGCGWGSLTLWMAEHFPRARILAMSNSCSQREWIMTACRQNGLSNVECVTADINEFDPGRTFDRIVSVEMFEHVRNYRRLLERTGRWLRPGGKLFVHVFAHHAWPYLFGSDHDDDWMGRYFFTGGTMPSHGLLPGMAEPFLALDAEWRLDGLHYQRTLESWLQRQDRERDQILPIFRSTYGADAERWFQRWRVFFMACSELFGYREGREWGVSHYRFAARATADRPRRARSGDRLGGALG